ncbi:MAG: TetR/AcrR family transcriptional regulator [Steroidobacteraceae bacterium]
MADKRRTPLTRRGQAAAGRIREAAARLFLARGYDAVSIDDIIELSGGSKSSVYSLFHGKEQLFVTVIGDLCDQFAQALAAVDVAHLDAAGGLRMFGRRLLEILMNERHLAFYRLALAQAGRIDGVGREWQRHGPEATCRLMAQFIAQRQGAGDLRTDFDAYAAARLFHDMIAFNLVHRAVVGDRPSPRDVRGTIAGAVDLFMRGYAVHRPGPPRRLSPSRATAR